MDTREESQLVIMSSNYMVIHEEVEKSKRIYQKCLEKFENNPHSRLVKKTRLRYKLSEICLKKLYEWNSLLLE